MEKSVECLAGETEVLGEILPQCRFVHHKPHMLPVREPGQLRWKPASNRLSYGTAYLLNLRSMHQNSVQHLLETAKSSLGLLTPA
jgi:hypothetical protein